MEIAILVFLVVLAVLGLAQLIMVIRIANVIVRQMEILAEIADKTDDTFLAVTNPRRLRVKKEGSGFIELA